MKNIFNITFLLTGLLFSQSEAQIQKAKDVIQKNGISIDQAKSIAREKGYSDSHITNVLNKEKNKSLSTDDYK